MLVVVELQLFANNFFLQFSYAIEFVDILLLLFPLPIRPPCRPSAPSAGGGGPYTSSFPSSVVASRSLLFVALRCRAFRYVALICFALLSVTLL